MERMDCFRYDVSFTTPAFLGGAGQKVEWRSPPFKALLRHWWRVWRSGGTPVQVKTLRQEEGELFGNAWLEKDKHRASQVRVAIRAPDRGADWAQDQWPARFGRVATTADAHRTRADLYLGYGPLLSARGGQGIELKGGALAPGATGELRLRLPAGSSADIAAVLDLIDWFGTVGSRARNGWGSVALAPRDGTAAPQALSASAPGLLRCVRPWEDCLDVEWPHAIGCDAAGRCLVWTSAALPDWRSAIELLAEVKASVRTRAKQGPLMEALLFLGYPAGTGANNPHKLKFDGPDGRLPSQLRFKVRPTGGDGSVVALVYHVPCAVPESFRLAVGDHQKQAALADIGAQRDTWRGVHETLDHHPRLHRLGDGA